MPTKKAKAKSAVKPAKALKAKTLGAAAGYSKKTLREKLGIKSGTAVAIIDAPENYAQLTELSAFDTELDLEEYDFLHFFAQRAIGLGHAFPVLVKRLKQDGMLWISWPKGSSGIETDLNENIVREIGLTNGLVDVKVAAIDDVWSGLKFVYRLRDRT
jgi:hypothetical protein